MKQQIDPKLAAVAVGVLLLVLVGIGWKLFFARPSLPERPPPFAGPGSAAPLPSPNSPTPMIPGGGAPGGAPAPAATQDGK